MQRYKRRNRQTNNIITLVTNIGLNTRHTQGGTRVFVNIKFNKTALKKARKNQLQMKTTPSKFKPFTYVTRDDNKVVIIAGNTQMSPIEFDNERQAEEYLQKQPYEMTINLFSILMYYQMNDKNEKEK